MHERQMTVIKNIEDHFKKLSENSEKMVQQMERYVNIITYPDN